MNDLLKSMIEHPIATWFVVGVTADAVVRIISSAKKNVSINISTKSMKTES